MKFSLTLSFLTAAAVVAFADVPKSGQSLGTITTNDGKIYANSTLAVIEPDGISILYADGGAKIAFDRLSTDLQKEFGYDPQKAAFFAREQTYLQQIDQLQRENAQLKMQLSSVESTSGTVKSSIPQKDSGSTPAAFHSFLYSLQAQSKGMKGHKTGSRGIGAVISLVYSGGPLDGMTKDESVLYAQQLWEQMSPDDQRTYANKASAYGDPIAQQEQRDAAAAAHPSGATVYNSDGTTSQVQYH